VSHVKEKKILLRLITIC